MDQIVPGKVCASSGRAVDTTARDVAPKPYEKPILMKGPVLSQVTADTTTVSGIPSDLCWVARAAFGESDIRWMIFRGWLLDDAPAWFRRLYIRHGEKVGSWLARRNTTRRVVRTLMMPVVRRKLRGRLGI